MEDVLNPSDPFAKTDVSFTAPRKPPRKPRPSEIAKKLAKLKLKAKRKPKFVKTAKRQTPVRKAKRWAPKKVKKTAVRMERLNFRVTKAEKGKLKARAKAAGGTITDVLIKLIAKLK